MTYVQAISTHLPPYRYSTEHITKAADEWLSNSPSERALFERLASSTKIENRAFGLPIEELLALRGQGERSKIFIEVGTSLLTEVVKKGLSAARASAEDVTALIMTSCSVPSIPSIDTRAIGQIGIPATVLRLPVFQYGCAGGAIGISLAQHLSSPEGITILASVELCSLVYQAEDLQAGNIVGSAIFGDGAACVVVSQKPGPLKVVASQSFLIPNTCDLMGYDLMDDGAHLRLDREIPQALLKAAPATIDTFLQNHGLTTGDISWWLFHPGGAKILSSLEESFGLSRDQAKWGWDTLRENGNMSSASILFALEAFLRERPYRVGDKMLMLGVGPGLTLQVNLFECC